MIKLNYYQIYNNGVGEVLTPNGEERKKGLPRGAIECDLEFETSKELEEFRADLEFQHTSVKTPNVTVIFTSTLIPEGKRI